MAGSDGGRPEESGESEALSVLLERSLQGDPEALNLLITLLQTKYYKRFTVSLKRLDTPAHTQTIEDVVQDSVIRLMEKIRAGELDDLKPEDRKNFLKYFQRVCDGGLRNAIRARKSPVLDRNKPPVPEEVIDANARIPGEERHTEHLVLMHEAMARLDPENARILKLYTEGIPYQEIARITGKRKDNLKNIVLRAREALFEDIAPRSATAQLNYEKEQKKEKRWPTRTEIEEAVSILPPEIKEAVVFVHLEHRTIDELARKLGDRGYDKAQARLKQAYRSLSGGLKASFPEAFEKAGP